MLGGAIMKMILDTQEYYELVVSVSVLSRRSYWATRSKLILAT